jgi:DNA invertase Pin-like site-specific DNA recombinase
MTDGTVEEIRTRVEGRLKELEPYVNEYQQLQRVREAIGAGPEPPEARRRAAPRRALRDSGGGRAGQSARAEQAQKLIAEEPGVTVAELATAMGIGPTYLYRLLPRLEREGKLRKEGKGYHTA